MPDPGSTAATVGVSGRGLRRTPCVGVCSTTYGDLVCRGCKRYAHEIVGWNGYDDDQRHRVWTRLNALLTDSVRAHLDVVDEGKLRAVATRLKLHNAAELPAEVLAFRTLRTRSVPLEALGLHPRHGGHSAVDAARTIDAEFYVRSRAHYEASFKTLT
ncbi:MAG: DUF1289 domain-containing protein [Gammaproteobacteria bacterium]|nr:DUF1289 domain-containing protein [Gammaproteobacteria bacterium]MXY54793.1 DUF1289 domain-containing protein [Gammaproteobacteria bacterium]MYF28670.1 DUF1289 domain-containing protein [Gammaproteobacteria bacterium]MYK48149.1 DUF1289 domain-containing protein [Gammaproteobacteria bacterium]